jgi:hypothetical protein
LYVRLGNSALLCKIFKVGCFEEFTDLLLLEFVFLCL